MKKVLTDSRLEVVSNRITDLTLNGASEEVLAREIAHSLEVLDAIKAEQSSMGS